MGNIEPATGSDHDPFALPAQRLGGITTTAIRTALQAQIRGTRAGETPDLRRLASLLALEARRRAMLPEQIVVTVKQVWMTLPEAHMAAGGPGAPLIDRLIGLCIEEYYRHTEDR